jgi:LCP family protein required for cell wall assembly
MPGKWRKRALWTSVLALASVSYGACAWLWAAPYRPAPSRVAPLTASPRSERVTAPIASVSAPIPDDSRSPAPASAPTLAPASPLPPALITAKPARTPALSSTRNFLIVGLDRRADGTGPALADTLVLVVLDEHSDHVGLISIPRDLYVAIPEATTDRINTVYQVAKRAHKDPLDLLSRVVEDTLKLPVEHAIALDLGVFERAVDAVGGVDVDIQCPIRDNFVDSREPGGRRRLDLDAGSRHLDGATAAMYVRSRHGRSDFSRARRQQAVLLGVQHALSGRGLLQLPALWDAFETSVETDMRRIQLLALARRALAVEPSHLHGLVIGHEHVTGFRTPEGKSVVLPNYGAIDAALAKLFDAPSPGARPQGAPCEAKDAALGGGPS